MSEAMTQAVAALAEAHREMAKISMATATLLHLGASAETVAAFLRSMADTVEEGWE